jgi:hypothetical protein
MKGSRGHIHIFIGLRLEPDIYPPGRKEMEPNSIFEMACNQEGSLFRTN